MTLSFGRDTTQNMLYYPYGIAYDSSNSALFVAESSNNRITVFDVASITNGEDAIGELGQPDFTTPGGGTTQNTFSSPQGLVYNTSNNTLFVADTNNNRILVYNFIRITTGTFPGGTAGEAYTGSVTIASSTDTVSYSVYSGSLPTGTSINTSTGEVTGTLTTAGTYTFAIEARDTDASAGYLFDRASYSVTIAAATPNSTPATAVSGGTAIPAGTLNPPTKPKPTEENPKGEFKVIINNGEQYTNSTIVNLNLISDGNTARMAISNNLDFAGASQVPFEKQTQWNICGIAPKCKLGEYTVYAD